jgi:hypothetical protein
MSSLVEQQIIEKLKTLPLDKQQEVLDFIEHLKEHLALSSTENTVQPQKNVLFAEAIHKYSGCVDGSPTDLSTKKAYMEGFGEE